jgi:hypothetical protein
LNDYSATKDAVAESVVFLDATNIAFTGSNVVSGDGVGIVIATGSANQVFFCCYCLILCIRYHNLNYYIILRLKK